MQKCFRLHGLCVPFGKDFSGPEFSLIDLELAGKKKQSFILLGPVSLVNHSCAPNAVYWMDKSKKSNGFLQIRALRRIEVGEEILVLYAKDVFGPDCECSVCYSGQTLSQEVNMAMERAPRKTGMLLRRVSSMAVVGWLRRL